MMCPQLWEGAGGWGRGADGIGEPV